jgi:hypothetical protein
VGRTLELEFPLAGVVRRRGFEGNSRSRGGYPTPWAVNVRPTDPFDGRLRGGSRPGLTDYTGSVPSLPDLNVATEGGDHLVTEAGDNLVVSETTTESLNAEVMAAVKAFGVSVLSDAVAASAGTAPTGYTMACLYRDRLVLSCDDKEIYFSRQGDFTDWDYGADVEDAGRATLLQLSQAGEIGGTVTAMIPFRDRLMLLATADSLWLLSGDPSDNGTLQLITEDVGIISSTAWCDTGGRIVFLADDGLYSIGADGSKLESLTDDKLPSELTDVDTSSVNVYLGYHHENRGVYLFLVNGSYHYFYDMRMGGIWPFTLPSANDPSSVFNYAGNMILYDGTSSYWTVEGDDDDGTAIQSHVVIGPLRGGSAAAFGMLQHLHGVIETGTSDSVTWRIVTGDTAESAAENAKAAVTAYLAGSTTTAEAYASANGALSNGRSRVFTPRVKSMWFTIWLQSTAKWAFESMVVETTPFGKWRS